MLLFGRALIALDFATPFKDTTRGYRVFVRRRCLCFCGIKSERDRRGEVVFVDENSLFYDTYHVERNNSFLDI